MNIAVYGNCQAGPLGAILKALCDDLKLIRIDPVHLLKSDRLAHVNEQLARAEVVIHQPIGIGFREFSSEALKKRFPEKVYISFPSLYFAAYFPNLTYIRKPGGGTLKGVLDDYHDDRVAQGFLRGKSAGNILQEMAELNRLEGVETINRSIQTLSDRDKEVDIKCAEFIELNYKKRRLFYVMNHPSNYMLIHVAFEILKILRRQPKANVANQISLARCYLSNYQVPIEQTIMAAIGSRDLSEGCYSVRRGGVDVKMTAEEFVGGSLRVYEATKDFRSMYEYAAERRKTITG